MTETTTSLGQVLHEVSRDPTWDVREALFLTFNADLGFFERAILGSCRALGARVTVLADAHVWDADPVTMARAGVEYNVGLASMPGAFHPKLMLLVGSDRVLAAVGSGNLTLGGWQYNSEVFTVLRAAEGRAPDALRVLGHWLRALPEVVFMPDLMQDSLARVAAELEQTLASVELTAGGCQVLHTLDVPLLAQLPQGSVSDLVITAPFLDTRAEALEQVIDRLSPQTTTLVVQSGRTSASSSSLASLQQRLGHSFRIVDDQSGRYRHAKLIEARSAAETWSLTGSANISAAALLRTARQGGNVELALLMRGGAGVWPEPGVEEGSLVHHDTAASVGSLEFAAGVGVSAPQSQPTMLGVHWRDGVLRCDLATAAKLDVDLECTGDPIGGHWRPVNRIPIGTAHIEEPFGVVGDGMLFRLTWRLDGERRTGPVLPLNIYERVTSRPVRAADRGSGRLPRDGDDLLGEDWTFLVGLQAQISHICEEVKTLRAAASSAAAPENAAESHTDQTPTGWMWELERAARAVHGPGLAAFALGLPALPTLGRWESFESDQVGELEGDQSDVEGTPPAEDHTTPPVLDHRKQSESLRRRRRERVTAYAHWDGPLSVLTSLTAARLALCFYCAGNWDDDDATPIRDIEALLSRARAGAFETQQCAELAALAAVASFCVRSRVDHRTRGPVTLAWRALEEVQHELPLEGVSDELLFEYCKYLSTAGGTPVDAQTVREDLLAFSGMDAIQPVVLAAEQRAYDYERVGPRSIRVQGAFNDPKVIAFDLAISASGRVGVWVDGLDLRRSGLCMVEDADIYLVSIGEHASVWEHFTAARGPGVLRESMRSGERSRFRVSHGPLNKPMPDALELAKGLGMGLLLESHGIRARPGVEA